MDIVRRLARDMFTSFPELDAHQRTNRQPTNMTNKMLDLGLVGLCVHLVMSMVPTFAFAADGRTLFTTCSACHGSSGEGNVSIGAPNIAGMPAWYTARQLANFSSDKRGTDKADTFGAQMRAAAMSVNSDEQRDALAKYIASLPGRAAKLNTNSNPAELVNGRNQFNAICSSCHGGSGRGNQALGAPGLVGLEISYAERQLRSFREGQRGAHPEDKWGAQMRVGASMLPNLKSGRDALMYAAGLK